jgi:hypothetical protein
LTGSLDAFGIDVHRPVAFAVAGLSAEQRRAVDALHAILNGGVITDRVVDEVEATMSRLERTVGFRLVLPARDAALLRDGVRQTIGARWHEDSPQAAEAVEDLYRLGGDTGTVTVDFAMGRDAHGTLEEMTEGLREAHEDPPALEGRSMRLTYTPRALADVAFMTGMQMTYRALHDGNVDPSQIKRIFAEGLRESAQSYVLAADSSDRPYFDRVEAEATLGPAKLELLWRATDGPGLVPPADALWAREPLLRPQNAWGVASVAPAWAAAWPLSGSSLLTTVREAGAFGYWIALPLALPALATWLSGQVGLPSRLGAIPSIDREGVAWLDSVEEPVFIGMLAPSVSGPAAECILSGAPPCPPKARLSRTSAREVKHGLHARLAEADGRRAVLMAADPAVLARTVQTENVPPLFFDVRTANAAKAFEIELPAGIPDRVVGRVERIGRTTEFRVTALH